MCCFVKTCATLSASFGKLTRKEKREREIFHYSLFGEIHSTEIVPIYLAIGFGWPFVMLHAGELFISNDNIRDLQKK